MRVQGGRSDYETQATLTGEAPHHKPNRVQRERPEHTLLYQLLSDQGAIFIERSGSLTREACCRTARE